MKKKSIFGKREEQLKLILIASRKANLLPIKKGLIAFGQGSGHGGGMSQWGAKYLASKGQKAERILKHFYRGVQIKPFRKDYL